MIMFTLFLGAALMAIVVIAQAVRVTHAIRTAYASDSPAQRAANAEWKRLRRRGKDFSGHPDDWTEAQFNAVYRSKS